MGEESGEKTEEPTPHKLREARKKGQIAKSKDLTTAILLVTSFYILKLFAVMLWEEMVTLTVEVYTLIPEEFTTNVAGYILMKMLWTFAKTILPILGLNFLIALISELLQVGFLASIDPLIPDLNKLNPIEGVKKFFSLKQFVELIKSLIKMTIVVILIYIAIKQEFYMVVIAQQLGLWQVMSFVGQLVMKVILWIGGAYFVIGLLDYLYQRYEFIKSLRMSKKEIKDEYKRLEGDPMIKQRQRDAQRQMSQGRQMGAVPGADVVVTNPIHYAIAIEYKPNEMKAPRVIAKGEHYLAQRIKELAEENEVPVVENAPLARALFAEVQVDRFIPPQYYKAVAEILAFVYNLRKRRKHRH